MTNNSSQIIDTQIDLATSLTGIADLDSAVLAAARQHGSDIGRDEALGRDPGIAATAETAFDTLVAEVGGGVIAVSYAVAGMDPDAVWEFTRLAWREAFVAAYDAGRGSLTLFAAAKR